MKQLGQLFLGLVTALSSSLLVLAAVSLALAEGSLSPTQLPPTSEVAAPASPAPGETLQVTPPAATLPPVTPTACKPPDGWMLYTVQNGDTVESLAAQAGLTVEAFSKANCLISPSLPVGSNVHLPAVEMTPTETPPPPLPTIQATDTPFICTIAPPAGWVIYYIQPGDNLYRLGQAFGTTAGTLQEVNCLPSVNSIKVGAPLYVPNVATRTPVFRPTVTPSSTDTMLPPTDTETPTETATNTPTETKDVTPSTPNPQVTISATSDTTPAGNTVGTPGGVSTSSAATPSVGATPASSTPALPATQAAPLSETGTPAGTPPATH